MNSDERVAQIIGYGLPYLVSIGLPGGEIRNVEVVNTFDDGPCEVILPEVPYLEDLLRRTGLHSSIRQTRQQSNSPGIDFYLLSSSNPFYHAFASAAGVKPFSNEIKISGRCTSVGEVRLSSRDIDPHLIYQPRSGLAHSFLMPSRELLEWPSHPTGDGPFR